MRKEAPKSPTGEFKAPEGVMDLLQSEIIRDLQMAEDISTTSDDK